MNGCLIPQPQSIRFTQGTLAAGSCVLSPEFLAFVPKAHELVPPVGGSAPVSLELDPSMGRSSTA